MKNHKLLAVVILLCIAFITLDSFQCNLPSKDHSKDKGLISDADIPQPIGFVNDFEDVFSKPEEITLDSLIKDYNKRADIQIVLATFDTNIVSLDSFPSYTLKVAQQWGVGEKVKNNGVFIGISKGHRTMYIHNGLGTERFLSDEATKSIIDTAFVPEFKKGNIFAGTLKGLHALMISIADKKH